MKKPINREDYLNRAAIILDEELFKPSEYKVPSKIRYATSFPSRKATGAKLRTIGQCWSSSASTDSHFEIMVSPVLDDLRDVIATLLHEMVHAVVGLKAGHKKPFKDCAIAVGLEGKMTATNLSDDTWLFLSKKLIRLGNYPHARLNVSNQPKKQSTRNLKAICDDCGYGPLRASKKVFDADMPVCPKCNIAMVVDID